MNIKRIAAFILAAALSFVLIPTPALAAAENVSDFVSDAEWAALKLVNSARIDSGKMPLSVFSALKSLSDIRVKETLELFDHTRPDGTGFDSILRTAGIKFGDAGENIATGFSTAPESHSAFMSSSGHRANILNDVFIHAGISRSGNNWCQLFIAGCTPSDIRIEHGPSGGIYDTGTKADDFDEILVMTCSHGESYMPLTASMVSGYDELLTDKKQTLTVTLEKYGLSAAFSVTLRTVPEDITVGGLTFQWSDEFGGYVVTAGDPIIDGRDLVIPTEINGKNVVAIGDSAFVMKNYASVVVPEGVRHIGDFAFQNATINGTLYLPSTLKTLGDSALAYIYDLKAIEVDKKNTEFTSIDGVLFDKKVTTLIQYPLAKPGKVYTIPESVTKIGDLAVALAWRGELTAIIAPNPMISSGKISFFGTRAVVYCSAISPLYTVNGSVGDTCGLADIINAPIPFSFNTSENDAADMLSDLGLIKGTEEGYSLDRTLTRQQAVTMLVRLLGMEQIALRYQRSHPFTDVDAWASPYVGYAYERGITNGISSREFGGGAKESSVAQYITFLLRALGYDDSKGDFDWKSPWTLSDAIGLTDGRYKNGTDALRRGDMVMLTCSALECWMKDGGRTLGYELFGDDWR